MIKRALFAATLFFAAATSANAIVIGTVDGPDTAFLDADSDIMVRFTNSGPLSVTNITLGGGTALDLTWVLVTPQQASQGFPTIAGIGTGVVSFSWNVGEFSILDFFYFDGAPFRENPHFLAMIIDLLNLAVVITMQDGSQIFGKFIDDTTLPNSGLVFAADPVPLPAALPLFVTGLGVMGLLGWRRKRKGAAEVVAE